MADVQAFLIPPRAFTPACSKPQDCQLPCSVTQARRRTHPVPPGMSIAIELPFRSVWPSFVSLRPSGVVSLVGVAHAGQYAR